MLNFHRDLGAIFLELGAMSKIAPKPRMFAQTDQRTNTSTSKLPMQKADLLKNGKVIRL